MKDSVVIETLEEAAKRGVIRSYSYASEWSVERGGIFVGLLVLVFPCIFWYFMDWNTAGVVYLIPILGGSFLFFLGILSYVRDLKRRRTRVHKE